MSLPADTLRYGQAVKDGIGRPISDFDAYLVAEIILSKLERDQVIRRPAVPVTEEDPRDEH